MTKKISSAPSYRETDLEITDSGLLLQLLGPNDCNIKLIKKAFKIKIWLRGNLIKMSGPGEGIEAAEMVIAALTQLVESGKDIDTFDVENCISKLDSISPEVRYSKKAGVIKTSKKTITAKGPNQLEYIQNIEDTDVTFGTGVAGCGKTYLAMAMAIQAVLSGKFRKIVLCRPAVEAGEKLGFLPGDLAEKVNPYLRPLYDALGDMVEADKAADMIKNGVIEVAPLAFLRGRSLNHSFILLDEAQNTTVEQMKMFLTRMGTGSKMVITGDSTQVDLELPDYKRNGLDDAVYLLEGVTGVAVTRFTSSDVVRHPLVQRIVCAYDARDERRKKDQRN